MTAIAVRWRAILTRAQEAFAAERQQQALWLPVAMGTGILLYFSLRSEPDARLIWLAPGLIIGALLLARRWSFCGWLCALAAAGFFRVPLPMVVLGLAPFGILASWYGARSK
jgi:competence protein ComEC